MNTQSVCVIIMALFVPSISLGAATVVDHTAVAKTAAATHTASRRVLGNITTLTINRQAPLQVSQTMPSMEAFRHDLLIATAKALKATAITCYFPELTPNGNGISKIAFRNNTPTPQLSLAEKQRSIDKIKGALAKLQSDYNLHQINIKLPGHKVYGLLYHKESDSRCYYCRTNYPGPGRENKPLNPK